MTLLLISQLLRSLEIDSKRYCLIRILLPTGLGNILGQVWWLSDDHLYGCLMVMIIDDLYSRLFDSHLISTIPSCFQFDDEWFIHQNSNNNTLPPIDWGLMGASIFHLHPFLSYLSSLLAYSSQSSSDCACHSCREKQQTCANLNQEHTINQSINRSVNRFPLPI